MASDERGVKPGMRVRLINPNTTASMTAAMVRSAQAVEQDAEPIGATARNGVPAIDGHGDVLCLGCGGLIGLRERLERQLGVPVVEAVPVAMAILCGLIRAGLRTSKARGFSTTLSKETP